LGRYKARSRERKKRKDEEKKRMVKESHPAYAVNKAAKAGI
jgi:hypothetical protein